MISINKLLEGFKPFLEQLKHERAALATRRIEQQLEAEVEVWLHRPSHQRRHRMRRHWTRAVCDRCGSRQAQDFSRNGHRRRQLVTTYGVVMFWLPRVVGQCGGSVSIPFSLVAPYQRFWEDVVEQVERWAQLGMSLRQMQAELGWQTQVGLRTLNNLVQRIDLPTQITLTSVPPVVLLDAMWVSVLHPTAQLKMDRLGRRRVSKIGDKQAVLVARGVYPQNQQWGILDWELASGEDQAAWERLLVRLDHRGVYRERGVALIIHDGGKGLSAALDLIYPHIPHQRCLFHKLRNLWCSIQVPTALARSQIKAFKGAILQQAAAIYRAPTQTQTLHRRDAFCQQYRSAQPELTATLLRDWDDTVAFYAIKAQFPRWQTCALRTTSLLERVNRLLRHLFRAANAYHSMKGLLATVIRILCPFRLI